MTLPSALATEAYQLPFDPDGSSIFGTSLPALLERAGKVAAQRRQQSLEEALVKTEKQLSPMTFGPMTSDFWAGAGAGAEAKPSSQVWKKGWQKSRGMATPKGNPHPLQGTGKTGDRP